MTFLSAETLYIIGLVLVSLYLLVGLDDFIWDIVSLIRRFNYRNRVLDLQKLDNIPPKLLAFSIAAWHEDNVIGDVIENIIESAHYPRSMYHIFLGVYPNDEPTIKAAYALSEKYPNVHVIVNLKPGPTSKAQNLNYVIKQMKEYERKMGWTFAGFTVHDSEDVVHPYEFKVTNFLLDSHKAIQFPLFPLMQKPSTHNFFKNLTTCTYADEFAENHFTTMVSRYQSGAFVPSAGTGFTLSRETIDSFGDDDVLPSDSLTEDYRMALTLFEKGIQMYYVLEKVPRISEDDKLTWDFIATRSMFPTTFKTAVKQKTRWILGITMQSFKFKDIFKIKGMKFAGRYSMYKDLKAKVGNMLVFVGYPVLAYVIASIFIPLTPIYPAYTLSWYISLVVTAMMIDRQLFRGVAVYNVYGMRSVFFAVLLPPILPIRLIWGNLLNMVATMRAYKQSIFGTEKKHKKERKSKKAKGAAGKQKKKLSWDKTHHYFLGKSALKRYHRKLGDVLMEKGYVTPEQLQKAMRSMPDTKEAIDNYLLEQANSTTKKQKYISQEQLSSVFKSVSESKQSLGQYFLRRNIITEQQLLTALSAVKHIQYFDIMNLDDYNLKDFASYFDEKILRELLITPLLKTRTGFVIAFCDNSPMNAQSILRSSYDITVHAVFASQETVGKALDRIYSPADDGGARTYSLISDLYSKGIINYEQVIIAYNYKNNNNLSEQEVLKAMGLLPCEDSAGETITEELEYTETPSLESSLQPKETANP